MSDLKILKNKGLVEYLKKSTIGVYSLSITISPPLISYRLFFFPNI
jgi:hypothetical protein